MVKSNKIYLFLGCTLLTNLSFGVLEWGFYAHRKINFYAALTIPPPVNQFFKSHIDFLSRHAVDPDQRRYAIPGEASRHFIDLDRWYENGNYLLSGDYTVDRILMGCWEWKVDDSTILLNPNLTGQGRIAFDMPGHSFTIDSFGLRSEMYPMGVDSASLISSFLYPGYEGQLIYTDTFTSHGILPYHIEILYHRLVKEMAEVDLNSIIRICTDMGHYVADAHVPLHTTSNYNGQFTDQVGIHAFWESRIPELYEEEYFTSLVGRAQYIDDIHVFVWNIVEHSYGLVPEVLKMEREARRHVSEQNQYCFVERGNSLVRTQCPELAKEYMVLMDGMVQEQWMASIRAIGSLWYSAWIDSGEPDLWNSPDVASPDTTLIGRIWEKLSRRGSDRRGDVH